MKSPNEELIELIAQKLLGDCLLLHDDMEQYKAKLISGMMKSEDWLLVVEKAIDKEAIK